METREREIDLLDLFWKCLFAWRKVLACAIIFAILVPLGMYGKNMISYKKAVESFSSTKVTVEDYNEKMVGMSVTEKRNIQNALSIQNNIMDLEEYNANAPIMSFDPFNVYRLSITYYVDSEYTFNYTNDNKESYTPAILSAYDSYINSFEFRDAIFNDSGLEFDMMYSGDLVTSEASDAPDSLVKINVVYNDKKVLEKIVPNIEAKISTATPNISETIGAHTLKLMDKRIGKEVVQDVSAIQEDRRNRLYSFTNQYNSIYNAMSDEQKEIVDGILAIQSESKAEPEETIEAEALQKPEIGLGYITKYGIVGAVLGIFLMAGYIVMMAILSGKLQNDHELAAYYSLRILGRIFKNEDLKGIDKLIYNIKNKNSKPLTLEAAIDVICSNIELECKGKSISSVYLTGSYIEKVDKNLIDEITSQLSNLGINAIYGENISYAAASLRKMVEIGAVVLVEQAGLSVYAEIDRELVTIKEHNIDLIGCIALEG